MQVKSFGCSFIFGTDLADDGSDLPYPNPSNFTWPALIAQRLGVKYQCHARGGAGNLQILDQLLTESYYGLQDLYIIGWSWVDRFDYRSSSQVRPWSTLHPITETDVAKNYYKYLHSEYRDKLNSLVYVQTAIETLQRRNLPFIMTYMDPILFDSRWNSSVGMHDIQSRIYPHMQEFDNNTFLKWSQDQGFPISKTLHPLEPAHAAAAELIWPQVQAELTRHSLV